MLHLSARRPAVLAGLALIPALALTSNSASAQTADRDVEVHSLAVDYHDLDLSTAKGRAQLDGRVRRAAAMVCTPDSGAGSLSRNIVDSRCYYGAINAAQHKLAQVRQTKEQNKQLVTR